MLADLPVLPTAGEPQLLVIAIASGIAALMLLLLLVVVFRRRPGVRASGAHGESLAEYPAPPLVSTCQLFYLNEPVRLRLIIVAPQGRRDLPPDLETELDRAIRGLGHVLDQDRPAWRTWPAQLSWKGFLPQFTTYVHLPNEQDEPSHYQLVCGQIRLAGQMVVIGMVLMSDEAIHRQSRLLEAHQWVEQFRIEWYG